MTIQKGKRKRVGRRFLSKSILVLLLLTVAVLWAIYDSNYVLDVEEFTVIPRGLPKAFDGYTIVQISDLHGAQFGENNREIISMLRERSPDLIAVTGDMVDNIDDIPMVYDTASALADIAPTYFVPGNHEYGTRKAAEVFRILESAGVTVLRNQSVMIEKGGAAIALVGIDDPNGPADMMPMKNVIGLVRSKTDAMILMLNHRNERFAEFVELDVPMVITGHSHGGLIRLPFTDGIIGPGMNWFPQYTNGLYAEKETAMIASRGIGNSRNSWRLFNRPHIPVITLQSAE